MWRFVASLDGELIPVTMIIPPSTSRGARRSDSRDVRFSPHNRRNHSVGSPLSPLVVTGYEWVRDNVLKYRSSIISTVSFTALEHQLKLANPKDFNKITIQACNSDDFPFLRAVSGCPPFFFMYYCLFVVLGLILPLNSFQCAMLEHLNVSPSQLHPNS